MPLAIHERFRDSNGQVQDRTRISSESSIPFTLTTSEAARLLGLSRREDLAGFTGTPGMKEVTAGDTFTAVLEDRALLAIAKALKKQPPTGQDIYRRTIRRDRRTGKTTVAISDGNGTLRSMLLDISRAAKVSNRLRA